MHEAAIVQELITLAQQKAPPGSLVLEVHASVGRLTGVSPDAMQFYFEVLREEALGPQATLHVRLEPLRARCSACGRSHELRRKRPFCARPAGSLHSCSRTATSWTYDRWWWTMANLITIEQKILKKNADIAIENRQEIERRRLFAVGLVSAPGSGKTSLLERTLAALHGRRPGRGHRGRRPDRSRRAAHRRPGRAGRPDRDQRHLPSRGAHGPGGAVPGPRWPASTSSSSRTSATWSARPPTISASTCGWW